MQLKIAGVGIYEISSRLQRTGSAIDNRWNAIRSKADPRQKPLLVPSEVRELVLLNGIVERRYFCICRPF